MRILFCIGFTIIFYGVVANTPFDSLHHKIQYRDTSGTYIQIFSKDSITLEELSTMVAFEFSDVTGKKVKYFRTVDAFNIPEVSSFAAGNYSVRDKYCTYKNVEILQGKVNVITFFIPQATLAFKYVDDKNSVVINQAQLTKHFCEENCLSLQNCSEIKMYPPGKYVVEINTTPVSTFSIIMDYSIKYELQIPKPSKFIVNDLYGISSTVLYSIRGDRWVLCQVIDKAYTKDNPLLIQPSRYLLVWKKKGVDYEKKFYIKEGKNIEWSFDEWD